MSEPTMGDVVSVIRKIEGCNGIGAKVVLLRDFAKSYSDLERASMRETCVKVAMAHRAAVCLEEAKNWMVIVEAVSQRIKVEKCLKECRERIAELTAAANKEKT